MSARNRNLGALLALALVTLILAWVPRSVEGIRRPFLTPDQPELEQAGWYSIDPDGLYHTRRVERALADGLRVAGTDPYLAFPLGAAIPWPPYYDLAVAALLAPFAPAASPERRVFLEHAVATLPAVFGLASALLAVLATWYATRDASPAARAAGAAVAGATYALCRASINYSVVGTGDHHAWVSLLNSTVLAVLAFGLGSGALRSARRGALFGAVCGALAGLMLGSWVASLLYVLGVQIALAWLLLRRAREELPGVAPLGLAFHVAAGLALLPAVLASPWRADFPWMVVNLSWFHPAQLALGALVFVPPLALARGALASGTAAARRYPWIVGAVLVALAGLLALADVGPARGIRDGLAWVSRADAFMTTIQESAPLLGPRSGGTSQLFLALGYGVLLLPLAWLAMARSTFAARADALLPWVIAVPPLLVQALMQRRFGDSLALPMAVTLGWGVARIARGPWLAIVPGALGLAVLAQLPSVLLAHRQLTAPTSTGARDDVQLGERLLYDWVGEHARRTPDPNGNKAVLAHWDRGHVIEWVADLPTVATNFGSYIGLEGYRDPPRFFLSEDVGEAREILGRRRVRYVIVPGSLPDANRIASMIHDIDPALAGRYLTASPPRTVTSPRWLSTMGARLLNGGMQLVPSEVSFDDRSPPIGFLRLVHVSPYSEPFFRDPRTEEPMPVGFVFEHVPGATVAVRGARNEAAQISFDLNYPAGEYRFRFTAFARCDDSGIGRLWVPYSTEPGANGDAVVERAWWSVGARSGELTIPESAVQGGRSLEVR